MLAQLFRLFERYAARHLRVAGPRAALRAQDGTLQGYLDIVEIVGTRLHVSGWAQADQVIAHLAGAYTEQKPDLLRTDVAQALEMDPHCGFDLDLPLGDGLLVIELERNAELAHFEARLPGRVARARARLALWGKFLWTLSLLSPQILRGMKNKDPQLRAVVRDGLALGPETRWGLLDRTLFDEETVPEDGTVFAGVSIVLPIYNAFELLEEVLARVCTHTDIPWRLILIEDCSSDPRVRPWVRDWVERARAQDGADILLIENPENRGFIRSVNSGFEQALKFDDPVVLLNSDAFVPAGWVTRLLEPMRRDPMVATVTPMSNDAEIYSSPVLCCQTHLSPGQGDAMDRVAARFSPALPMVEAPTGVGFCMAMNMAFLRQQPRLDTSFGRGYGEEVDWCRRVAALGGKHVAQPRLFVEHRGGESFGSEEKLRLIRKNNEIIASRYPGYDLSVQTFIHDDPLLSPRVALALAWLDSLPGAPEIPVYVAHSMGGGADMYLEHRLQEMRGDMPDFGAVVLRMGGARRCQMEVLSPKGQVVGSTDDLDLVCRLVSLLRHRRIIYSCAVGDPDPVEIPAFLVRLTEGAALDILVHDYLPISPSYTLLGQNRVYTGPVVGRPEAVSGELDINQDSAHEITRPGGQRVTLAEWQTAWAEALLAAQRVVVFSQDSGRLMSLSYPEVSEKISVRPHQLLHDVPRLPAVQGERFVLGVLGNIGVQKGAAVLEAMSRKLGGASNVDLVLVGNIDPAFSLGRHVRVHGNYVHADIPALAARYRISAWLIPSIWPETFSYTTHEALRTGLPVLSFDLGAQGDAVRQAENGYLVTMPRAGLEQPADYLADAVLEMANRLSE